MNIAFFLVPKSEVICLYIWCTMRQALEKMEYHRYTAVPLIDHRGRFAGTLTEGDLLWKLKNTPGLSFEGTSKVLLKDVPRRIENTPVRIDSRVDDLFVLAVSQNFIPVIDDQDVFIGIIRRRELIKYYSEMIFGKKELFNT